MRGSCDHLKCTKWLLNPGIQCRLIARLLLTRSAGSAQEKGSIAIGVGTGETQSDRVNPIESIERLKGERLEYCAGDQTEGSQINTLDSLTISPTISLANLNDLS